MTEDEFRYGLRILASHSAVGCECLYCVPPSIENLAAVHGVCPETMQMRLDEMLP